MKSVILALALVFSMPITAETDKEFSCLVHVIAHEAGSEPTRGMIAVGRTVVNRVEDGRFGKTICDVIYAKGQFTNILKSPFPTGLRYAKAYAAANAVLQGEMGDFRALYFHNHSVSPKWGKKLLAVIGGHRFYA